MYQYILHGTYYKINVLNTVVEMNVIVGRRERIVSNGFQEVLKITLREKSAFKP